MLIVFLLLRIYEQLQTTHTLCTKPFSKTSSSVKSSQSADRSVRMSCEQDSFCQTSLQGFRAHALHSTLSQGHHQADFQVCQQQTTTQHKPPPQQIYTVVTILILATLFELQTQTLGMHLYSERIGITAAHPPHSLALAQGVLNIQALEDLQLKPGRLRPVSCFHMCQCNTITSKN